MDFLLKRPSNNQQFKHLWPKHPSCCLLKSSWTKNYILTSCNSDLWPPWWTPVEKLSLTTGNDLSKKKIKENNLDLQTLPLSSLFYDGLINTSYVNLNVHILISTIWLLGFFKFRQVPLIATWGRQRANSSIAARTVMAPGCKWSVSLRQEVDVLIQIKSFARTHHVVCCR